MFSFFVSFYLTLATVDVQRSDILTNWGMQNGRTLTFSLFKLEYSCRHFFLPMMRLPKYYKVHTGKAK